VVVNWLTVSYVAVSGSDACCFFKNGFT